MALLPYAPPTKDRVELVQAMPFVAAEYRRRGGLRRDVIFDGLAASLLWLQSLIGVLVGLQVLPWPTSVGSHPRSWIVESAGWAFLLLSSAVGFCLLRTSRGERASRHLLYLAYHDPCTRLPNRSAVEQILQTWLDRRIVVNCIYMEMDGVSGPAHAQTSSCQENIVRSSADRLQALLGPEDVLGHLSSDCFVMLLSGERSRADLTDLVQKSLEMLSRPHTLESGPVTTTTSIGVATSTSGTMDRVALLTLAKNAMAAARAEERNHFCFADDLPQNSDNRNSMLSSKLQRALLDGALQLVYQPIYDRGGEMVAAEALARWHDSDEGPIAPGEFVPVAEATGLIVPLSNWVLRKACSQMASWCALGSPIQRIAVNVSVKQVSRKDFIPTVRQILEQCGLEAHRLELEVTEGALASDFEIVNLHLQELRKTGVRISIDDFGTGYSSLSRVRELNADVLKIDRLFTQGAGESRGGAAMVQAIIDMAHTLQLSVIAEGIETAEQMSILRGMQCDEMQGFLLSRPQAAEVITAELQQHPASPHPARNQLPRLVHRLA